MPGGGSLALERWGQPIALPKRGVEVEPGYGRAHCRDRLAARAHCRDRLAAPANERPPSDDPRINIDGICRNMLSMDKVFLDSQKAKAASTPSIEKPKATGGKSN